MSIRVLSCCVCLVWLSTLGVLAQPKIAYVLPDIGAPGTGMAVEIIAPFTAAGSFGIGATYLNNPGDAVRVECVRAGDAAKLVFGPINTSWNGRLLTTMAFVAPDVQPNDWDWTKLRAEFRIPIRVVVNNVASNIDTFYLVKPWPLGNVSTLTDRVLGQGALGRRSRRGAMIVDSLILARSATYTVSTNDPDPSTDGNQGYLPFVLHAIGRITAPRVADSIATEISVSGSGVLGGPGGGGGAGAYVNLNFNGQAGTDGGDGYTGGGPGGYNFARTKKKPGVGSGGALPIAPLNTYGSPSLNGTLGGESTISFENAGGGTGHPFGVSGIGCIERTGCLPVGGAGGGSGSQEGKRGGAGGYATAGETEVGFTNGGNVVGNVNLVPLAGGSGGAGGNPDATRPVASSGGGGGGAISIHGRELSNVRITARGGVPTRQDLQGGCGSGGAVIAGARAVENVIQDVAVSVDGGTDFTGTGTGRHLTGGSGRLRVDGPLRGATAAWTGVSMDVLTRFTGVLTLSGSKTNDGVYVWIRGANGVWKEIVGPSQVYVPNDRWNATPAWPGSDSVVYAVAAASVPNPSTAVFVQQPALVFSQSAWNVIQRTKAPVLESDTIVNLGQLQCPGDVLRYNIIVRNPGPEPLRLTSSQIGPLAGFAIAQQPSFPTTLAPSQSAQFIITYTPQPGQIGIQRTELRIGYNDTLTRVIKLAADATPSTVSYIWRGLERDTLDIGRVCIGRPIVEPLTIRKIGKAPLTIIGFASASPAAMSVSGTVPIALRDSISFAQITLTFAAKRAGMQVVPILVRFEECSTPDTIYIRHTGVESQVTVIGNGQFGDVRVGDRREAIFELRNTGSSELDIKRVPTVPAPFSIVSITPTLPTKLLPGESLILVVAFAPTVVTRSTATLTVVADSSALSCAGSVDLLLAGTGVISDVTLSSNSLTYSPTAPCDSARQDVTITNKGRTAFKILSPPVINGQNPTSFRWSGGPLRDTVLAPGESARYSVTFLGNQGPDGVKTAVFSLRTDDQSIGVITISLNGQRASAALAGPRIVDLGLIRVGTSTSASFTYTNNSSLPLRVVSATVTGGTRIGVSPSQTVIDPGLQRSFTFTYTCRAEENVEDTVKLAIDQPCIDTISIIVRARGGSEQLSSSQKINFGVKSECAKGLDSVVYVNSGALPIELVEVVGISGPDASAFRLMNTSAVTGQTLQPGEQRTVLVEFDPGSATDGVKVAYVTLRAKINDTLVNVICELKGERRTSLFITPSTMIFGQVSITSTSTQSLIFSNSGAEPLVISDVSLIGGASSAFRVRSNPPAAMTIPPGGGFEVIVEFVPKQQRTYIDGVIIKLDKPCSDTKVLSLTGSGVVVVDVVASIPKIIESPARRDMRIPITATVTGEANRLDSAMFSFKLRYVSSMFALRDVVGGTIRRHEVLGGLAIVEFDLPPRSIEPGGSVIADLLGDMTIGPVDSTDVIFTDATIAAPNVTARLTTNDGSIVSTVCEAGGKRLITSSGRLRLAIQPNPVVSAGTVLTETYERGSHILSLVGIDGTAREIDRWQHDPAQPVIEHPLPVDMISSGSYILVLETPSRRRILPCTVIR
ncbi:MAG: choice-of-anchor D domain-containing protein [Candidatus Kapabacteria bacterium]|nr:choice-of-anchor D domain-containing protein [Candidatus Kapabacteria bacterium]